MVWLRERLLRHLRSGDDEIEFSVGFVSVMAGTLLAAELLKDYLSGSEPLSAAEPRVSFQFFSPLSRTNRSSAFARDPNCPMCDPSTIACQTWLNRYEALGTRLCPKPV